MTLYTPIDLVPHGFRRCKSCGKDKPEREFTGNICYECEKPKREVKYIRYREAMEKINNKFLTMTEDEIEAELEWIVEARGEGYTWKQLANKYHCSIGYIKNLVSPSRSHFNRR